MWKHFVMLCSVAVFSSYGQEVSDVLNAVVQLEQKVTGLLSKLNQTLSSCCQSSQSCSPNQEWKLAFRGTAGVGASVYSAYKDGLGLPANIESGCKQVGQNLPCHSHYRNNAILDNWTGISDVAFVVYKNNVKVGQVIFDGAGSNYMTWLDKAKVKDSSWTDIKTSGANYFSILGHQDNNLKRTFFMNQGYGTCPNDAGWFVAVDAFVAGCPWEQPGPYPLLKYSTGATNMNWNNVVIGRADYFAVLVRYFNLP